MINESVSHLRKFIMNDEQYDLLSKAKERKLVNASINPQSNLIAMQRRYRTLKPEKTPKIISDARMHLKKGYYSPSYEVLLNRATEIRMSNLSLKSLTRTLIKPDLTAASDAVKLVRPMNKIQLKDFNLSTEETFRSKAPEISTWENVHLQPHQNFNSLSINFS